MSRKHPRTEEQKRKNAQRMRLSRQLHPEAEHKRQLTTARNLLVKAGFKVEGGERNG